MTKLRVAFAQRLKRVALVSSRVKRFSCSLSLVACLSALVRHHQYRVYVLNIVCE